MTAVPLKHRASFPPHPEGPKGVGAAPAEQFAALPWRRMPDGSVKVLLITSRETRRWVIPKGWPMRGLKPHRAAEREAYEEAGLKGHIGKVAVGTYAYEKRLANGLAVPCEVSVYPLQVTSQRKCWPEMSQRDGRWFSPEEAADLVQEEDLQRLLRAFSVSAAEIKTRRKQRARRAKAAGRSKPKGARKAGSAEALL